MDVLMGIFTSQGRGEIYKIWFDNDPSGRCYIGQTVQGLTARKNQHIRDAERNDGIGCPLLDDATRRFGVYHMKIELIESGIETQEDLDAAERFWISQYNSRTPNGYNVKKGGQKTAEEEQTVTPLGSRPSISQSLTSGMLRDLVRGMDLARAVKGDKTSAAFNEIYQIAKIFRDR